jgi:hypothetical protein
MRHLPRRRETMPATPGRPSCTTRCGMRWHVLVRLVSSRPCLLVCWQFCVNVFGLGSSSLLCSPDVFPVNFAFLRKDLVVFLSTYGSAMRSRAPRCSCEFLFRKRALLTPTSRGCTLSKALQHAGDGRPTKDNECNAFRAPSHKTCANIQNHQE